MSSNTEIERKPVTVDKPVAVEYDLGLLCVNDPQPLEHTKLTDATKREAYLKETTRDNVQLLVNQILSLPLQKKDSITLVELPGPIFKLPREKSIPKPREPTRWEKFASKKGIQKKGKQAKLVYDEDTKEWVNKWGYKGANKKVDNQWLVEAEGGDAPGAENSEAALLDPRKLQRDERKKLLQKNLLQQKRNREQKSS
ncbi:hypothetical protein PICMEDRAFT_17933 [Pichia membranifaciens NRRL Y-2026]|uniref:Ribosome biogenesis regulatory protein n=1 Tax=Pichia membranifaciens NRRL Y-2026 TaxID=763406 RepID=A0A1E3NH60_9ASCO|nr:hypothetical protein PICMEDRAFT_17933 [Pichia membranifaciens NRRL Y-2026]ODQ45464.1 hypothetical protein PICMEDRAFT_17933 [Pichia membranifaciens NRRL Y-2026]